MHRHLFCEFCFLCAVIYTYIIQKAEELGVHSIWLRGFDANSVQAAFNLPDGTVPSLMLALGYPGEKSAPHKMHAMREPMEEFVVEL